jgi:GH25 family lysozyme M1 (1,4-beta-N-acetylmuramidase)
MNGGNWTLFDVTAGDVYEWTYCSDVGGNQSWNAELTLFSYPAGATLCYNDNSGRPGCSTAPFIRWTATYTGKVKLLTTVSGCGTNSTSPYSNLMWRDTSAAPSQNVTGLDVSSYQGTINWNQVKAAGFPFAFAKSTEGVGFADSRFVSYMTGGLAAGMYMGAYHFSHPVNNTAVAEANYFLSIAGPYITSCELPPVLDLEDSPTGPSLQSSFTPSALAAWVNTWCSTVQSATGIKPIIYIGAGNASYINNSVTTYSLWMDNPNGNPTTPPVSLGVWSTWAFKQYSWVLNVPGISGGTDADSFNGNLTALKTFMGCTTTGVEQIGTELFFNVSPNPATNELQIDYDNRNGEVKVDIYDMEGKSVLSKTMTDKGNLNISELNNGIYNVNLSTNIKSANKRLVILK